MRPKRMTVMLHWLFSLWLVPLAAWAQATAPTPTMPAPATPPADSAGMGIAAILVPLILLAILVAGVKLYDRKRKRDDEAMALAARMSDALLMHPALSGYPIVATVRMPISNRSEPVVELTGTVPSGALREEAVSVVAHELDTHGSGGRIEDHIAVDRLVLGRVA